jgi:hypothetical protein
MAKDLLTLYEPINTLKPVDEGIWIVADLGDEPPPEWTTEIDQLIFRGSRFMDEVVFFHRQSQTLILTDLIENFEPSRVARGLRWVIRLVGIADPSGKTPMDLRMTFLGRKAQARQAYKQMLAWTPEKIILAHGRWYPENGTAELKRAFQWLE